MVKSFVKFDRVEKEVPGRKNAVKSYRNQVIQFHFILKSGVANPRPKLNQRFYDKVGIFPVFCYFVAQKQNVKLKNLDQIII